MSYGTFWRDLHKTALATYERGARYVCPHCRGPRVESYKLTESVAFVAHLKACKARGSAFLEFIAAVVMGLALLVVLGFVGLAVVSLSFAWKSYDRDRRGPPRG